ncbi:hypothetical protein MXB_60, partial [Myxobolus squamalis]
MFLFYVGGRGSTGTVRETLFENPGNSNSEENELKFNKETDLTVNQVTHINAIKIDDMGLHKMGNPKKYEKAVTLHIYMPPYNR